MPSGAIYYGDLEYMNIHTEELVYNYDELNDKQKSECKKVRHGYGIELFGKTTTESG